ITAITTSKIMPANPTMAVFMEYPSFQGYSDYITVMRQSDRHFSGFRASLLKYLFSYKVLPTVMALAIAALVAWQGYSEHWSIPSIVGLAIFVGVVVYIGGFLGVWVSRKVYGNFYPSLLNGTASQRTGTQGLMTRTVRKLFWLFSGAVSAYVVTRVLYHFRGLPGLVLSIAVYLPSLALTVWLMVRAVEGRPVLPSRLAHRVIIVSASALSFVFTFWWIIELCNGWWGIPGIVISAIVCIGLASFAFWSRNRQAKTGSPLS
ncbi:MAG: hypothetical protein AB1603_07650, partial [Chloroflexota bacterium]